MRAAFARIKNDILIREIKKPVPGNEEVLIRVIYCGVCGTDIGMAYNDCKEFTPIGHEVVGVVEKIGSSVKHVNKGDRVTVECNTACGICYKCRENRPVSCENITSFFAKESGFAEYIKVPAKNVFIIGNMGFKLASLIEPLSVALCMVDLANLCVDDDVLIIGAGPVGLLALAVCKEIGVKNRSYCRKGTWQSSFKICRRIASWKHSGSNR